MARRRRLRLVVAVSIAVLLSRSVHGQTAPEGDSKPVDQQVEELRRVLESQRAEIERLEQDAKRQEEALRTMQQTLGAEEPPQTDAKKEEPPRAEVNAEQPRAGVYTASTISSSQSSVPQPEPGATPPPQCTIWAPPSAQAGAPQAILRISDSVCFRFGVEVQSNYEALQDVNSEGYSQNFYLRRARFLVLGILGHGVSTYLQMDGGAMLGYAGQTGIKNINTGFRLIDGFAQWAFAGNAMALQAGLWLVPSVRQVLTKNWEFMSLDVADWVYQEQTALTENVVRDYGVGLNGVILNDKLSYRVGVFDGYRYLAGTAVPPLGAPAGSRNPMRIAGRLMYDFFEPEHAYAYNGTFLGPNKVASVAFVGDGQGDYKAFGGDAFFQWPVGPGAAVTAEADYLHYDANHFVYSIGGTPTLLPEQQTFFANAGYSFLKYKVQPFVRYETLTYADPVNHSKEQSRAGGGVNYYVLGFNFKITGFYERIINKVQPTTASIKDQNRFVLQLQGFIY